MAHSFAICRFAIESFISIYASSNKGTDLSKSCRLSETKSDKYLLIVRRCFSAIR